MLTTETRAQRSLLERVVDGGGFLEDVSQSYRGTTEQFRPEYGLRGTIRDVGHLHARIRVVNVIELLWLDAGGLHCGIGAGASGHHHCRTDDPVACRVYNDRLNRIKNIRVLSSKPLTVFGQGENFHGRHVR